MFRNYLLPAWRNLTRNKIYALINVSGLALGICACIIIYIVAGYEFSFDDFHPAGNRIYRLPAAGYRKTWAAALPPKAMAKTFRHPPSPRAGRKSPASKP